MGNLPSQVAGEDELSDFDLEKAVQQKGDSPEKEENLFDFSILANIEALHKAIVSLKEVQTSEIQKRKSDIEQWLTGLTERGEKMVGIAQFVDFLTSKNIGREEAVEFFNDLDPDGDGNVEVTFVMQMLKDKKNHDLKEALIPCHILPGYVDIYLTDKPSSSTSSNLGIEIIKFLRRHRVDSAHLSSSITVKQMVGVLESRERLVNGRYHVFKEKRKEKLEGGKEEEEDEEVEESGGNQQSKVLVTKCYSHLSVSSNDRTMSNLTDNSMETYWQSNGSPRSHFIRVQMLSGIRLKNLSVGISTSDDSYMPKAINVAVGNSPNNLKEIKQYSIPREFSGKFNLLGSLNAEYQYIQVNIRGCHSDGCDTRVRNIYIQGYKFKKEVQPTVLDGLLMFYMNLISTTVTSSISLNPSLRDTILTQSKAILCHLPPLSLSKTSTRRPEFLTPTLTEQLDQLIRKLCLPAGDEFVSVDTNSLSIMIEFALTTGNINNILDSLQVLMDNVSLDLTLSPLMKKLESLEKLKFSRHASNLKLAVVKCDSETEEGNSVNNMFTNDIMGSGVPFKTVKEKSVVNVIVKGENDGAWLHVLKLHMKVPTSDTAARAGLLFALDCEDPKDSSILDQYTQYDTFTSEDWDKLSESEKSSGKGPIAYFAPEKEWKEIEVQIDCAKPAKYLLIKLLSQESSDQIAVHSLKVKGYELTTDQRKSNEMLRNMIDIFPLPPDTFEPLEGTKVLFRILVFLCSMLKDLQVIQENRSSALLDPDNFEESHISTENLSLEKIWSLYIPLSLSSEGVLEQCSLVSLLLLRYSIPFLKATPSKGGGDESSIPSAILSHLCSLTDNPNTESFIGTLSQEIIKNGVVVFFPGSKSRRKYLLEMVELVLTGEQPPSWWLKFEALCGYFSKTNNNSLLELSCDPDKVIDMDTEPVMSTLRTIITVASKEAARDLSDGAQSHPDDLVRLLCAMQSSLFFWIRYQLDNRKSIEDEKKWTKIKTIIHDFLKEYVTEVFNSCYSLLKKVEALETIEESVLEALRRSIVGQTLPEMLTFLGSFLSEDDQEIPVVSLLNTFQPLIILFQSLSKKVPHLFLNLSSKELKCMEERELSVWTRESPHNYENNSKITEEFVCPGAEKFLIEFDSRCRTERRYDYLQFTDSTGEKKTFDDVYGSDHWPTTHEFKGPKLSFYFYSDGSNNYWGYRFTIKAFGKGFPPLHWLFDLHINLSRMMGLTVSNILATKSDMASIKCSKDEEKKEMEALLRNDFWKTLLRGGYQVGKLTRSLSGAYATSPTDSTVYSYLYDLASDEEEETTPPLIEVCRAAKGGPSFGGPLVDKAITAVFAALIWHSQELREELSANLSLSTPKASSGILDAFVAAESLRRELVEARQKLLEVKENESNADLNEDEPVTSCRDKALYLLKFAGLSRVMFSSEERPGSPVIRRPSWGQKSSWRWQRVSSVVSTVSKIKQQVSREGRGPSLDEKHPSFETVLCFVRNSVLTQDRVHALIQSRSQTAKEISDAYNLAGEFLRVMVATGNTVEISLLVFLQNLLKRQRKFPIHYGLRLDGCGLELETRLRRSFQLFMRQLLTTINVYKKLSNNVTGQEEDVQMISCVFSHLLDISWQDYDHLLLRDIQLPDYLFDTIINSSASEEKVPMKEFEDEGNMIERYTHHIKLLELWKSLVEDDDRMTNFKESELGKEKSKETSLFLTLLSSNSKLGGVTSLCDGCKLVLDDDNKIWYRNMEIDECLNLCKECFFDGTGNRPDSHTSEHLFQQIGSHLCNGCGLSIISHRFLDQSDDTNYCIGCFRKLQSEKDPVKWTVYLLTETPAVSKSNKYLIYNETDSVQYFDGYTSKHREVTGPSFYNQHHSWMLFSSLALSMAHTLDEKTKTAGTEPIYQRYACELLLTCLQLVIAGLKLTLAVSLDEEKEKQKTGNKDKKQDKKEEKEKEKEEEGPINSRIQTDTPMDNINETTPTFKKDEKSTPKEDKSIKSTETPPITDPASSSDAPPTTTPTIDPSEAYLGRPLTGPERSFGQVFSSKPIGLGLLASVLPKELSLQSWIAMSGNVERVIADDILPILLKLARTPAVGETRQLQSILVATQYMARVSTEVADRAIEVLEGVALDDGSERVKTNGQKTTRYLFELGAKHLENSNISGAATVAECLLLLSKSTEWKSTVGATIGGVLDVPPDTLDLSGIFGLLVTAGFPKLLKEGSIVKWSKHDEEFKGVVVTAPSIDDKQISVIELRMRDNCSVKLSDVEVEETLKGCIMSSRVQQLLVLLSATLPLIDKSGSHQVECCWILSLVLKSLSVLLNTDTSTTTEGIIEVVLKAIILPDIVKLACKPTQLNSHWNLSDLEVVGISCYKPGKPDTDKTKKENESVDGVEEVDGATSKKDAKNIKEKDINVKDKEEGEEEEEEVKSKPLEEPVEATPPPPPPQKTQAELEEEAALKELTLDVKNTLKIMREAFQCSFAVVRAMYENAGGDMEKFIMSSDRFYDTDADCLKVPDDIKEEAKKWEVFQRSTSIKETLLEYQDSQEDMGVTGFMTVDVDLKNVTATKEDDDDLKKSMVLIPKEKDKKKDKTNKKEKSRELLQEHLKKIKNEDASLDRSFMLKVNKALIVQHSRQVLGSLLLQWPQEGPRINALLMGGLDSSRWFSLLDFLLKGLPEDRQDKILRNVILCSESTELVTLALTAVQCMTDVVVATERKDINYSTTEDVQVEDKVVVNNAAFIKLDMEVRRTLQGSVTITAKDSSEYRHFTEQESKIKGDEKENKIDEKIPGNTVCYTVLLNKQEETSPCKTFSFKVTGLQLRRFETSYSLLRILLNDTSSGTPPSPPSPHPVLPLVQLWPKLIAAACELTGEQRLKVIGLLLQFLHLSSCSEITAEHTRLDLTLLKPLWSLYTNMTKQEDKPDSGSLKPEIVRGLTELFLIVENLAQCWDVEQDLMVETISEDSILKWFERGVCKVGYVSLKLGLTNSITEAFIEAKKNYVPPPPPLPSTQKSNTRSGNSDMSSDDDDDDDDDNSSNSSSSSSNSSDSDSSLTSYGS